MAIDITKLIILVDSGEENQAQELIKHYLENLSSEERGEMYLSIGSIYYDLMAKNEKRLAELLTEQLEDLKSLNKHESEIIEEIDLEAVREQLQS